LGLREANDVECVEWLCGLQRRPNLTIDVETGCVLRVDGGVDQHRFVPDFRGIVALVADPHEIVGQPQGRHDLGRTGQQRANPHECLSLIFIPSLV